MVEIDETKENLRLKVKAALCRVEIDQKEVTILQSG